MRFTVLPAGRRPPAGKNEGFLVTDNWDDWFQFVTMFYLYLFDAKGIRHDVGQVKIGRFGLTPEQRRPPVPAEFEQLDETFFSLGQDDSYYETLKRLGTVTREEVLKALRDLASDPDLFERAYNEDVTRTSLLRSVSPLTVRGQFARIARGDARLTRYSFSYSAPKTKGSTGPPLVLDFEVTPDSQPPSNIHVLIGRNGVGKTRVLRYMSRALMEDTASAKSVGSFSSNGEPVIPTQLFSNLVSVTFSAFDPFEPLPERRDASQGLRYSYIGLQKEKTKEGKSLLPKSPRILRKEFVTSADICRKGARTRRWRRALESLETDPLFRESDVTGLADGSDAGDWGARAGKLFDKLSSGHKVVLLIITRLVETVAERTLVLLDEPEAHLHPPLLSAFIRALSDLLVQRNGVAIIATHSPVVLQEVPRTCAWKLRRTGAQANVERPEIETFGENVGILTREAFGLEVTHAGFHRLLSDATTQYADYEGVLSIFNEQLGAEARGIIRALLAATEDNRR
jgi:hypothetical protein